MMYSRSNIPRSTPTASRQGRTVHISPPRAPVEEPVSPPTPPLSAFSPPPDYNGTAFPYRDSEEGDNTESDTDTNISEPLVQAEIKSDIDLTDEDCDDETCPRYPIGTTYECDEDTCLPVIKYIPTISSTAENPTISIPPPVPDDMEPFITRRRQISNDIPKPETETNETDKIDEPEEGDEMQLLPQLSSLNVADDDMLLAALIILLLLSGAEEEIIMILAFLLLAK